MAAIAVSAQSLLPAWEGTAAKDVGRFPDQVMLAPEYHAFFTAHDVPFVLIPMEGEFNGLRFASISDYPPAMQTVFENIAPQWAEGGNRFDEGKRLGVGAHNDWRHMVRST